MQAHNYQSWIETPEKGANVLPSIGQTLPLVPVTRPFIRPFIGPRTSGHYARGLTLIELMAVLVVLTLLLGLGVPGITSFVQNNRMVAQTNDLLVDLNFARSEAIKRRTNVVICKSSNPADAAPTCSALAGWADGRVMFIDANNDKTLNAGERVLRIREPLEGDNTMTNAVADADLQNFVSYTATGGTWSDNDATSDIYSFTLCDKRGPSQGRVINVETTGRAAIRKNPASC